MSVFRLTRHTYERLTQSGSIRDGSDANAFPRCVSETNQVVTEFDYRQNLHMGCGVVALEPPPPYAIAMKELPHCMDRGNTQRVASERGADECSTVASPGNRGSPPPYEERERRGANGGSGEERQQRNSEIILLTPIPLSDNQFSNIRHSAAGNRI